MSSANPYREGVLCPECGRKTYANTRTGLLYSHTLPDSTLTCSASTMPVTSSVDADASPAQAPERPEPSWEPTPVDPLTEYPTQTRTSVRAASAGLPGHGKRR